MFNHEESSIQEGRDRSARRKLLISVSLIAAIVLTILIIFFAGTQQSGSAEITGVQRAGSPDFDRYRDKIQVEMIETIVHPNLIGMAQHEIRARVTNLGDQTLTAIEVHGRMLGLDDSTVAQAVGFPVPRTRQQPLPPGQSMNFSLKVDRPGNVGEELVKDHVLELRGLRF